MAATPTCTDVPPEMENFVVGIIGMGDMGKMYARRLGDAGWRIMACDREENYGGLCEEFASRTNIQILRNGHLVSRASDYIIYSVEAAAIDRVVAEYGPSTKLGAIVGGQTSCKDPEIKAFEDHLPADVDIVSCHSLHGPGVDTKDQPLVLIKHRASDASFAKVETVLRCLRSKHVYLTAHEHDRITADTQAVTHAAFLSMGKAWHASEQFPWESAGATGRRYVGGIENVKINLTMRIYNQKWHVYAGLAILNPEARKQIAQYARSVTELYKLMIAGREAELRARVLRAREKVFGTDDRPKWAAAPLLDDRVLDRFSVGSGSGGSGGSSSNNNDDGVYDNDPAATTNTTAAAAATDAQKPLPNNHLSLLAMVDCWSALGIVPYEHMICSTPLFRLWLGVTEHLFRAPGRLDAALAVAVRDCTFRAEDLEFTFAARGWAECVGLGHFDTWRERFLATQRFFEPRFADAVRVGSAMVRAVLETTAADPADKPAGPGEPR